MLTTAGFKTDKVVRRRIHIEYDSWIARMQTPSVFADAIKALIAKMPETVHRYFAIEADGSFMLDTASVVAKKSAPLQK
jgi:hypothetical protein